LENKYYQDSPVDFESLERMVTSNESLLREAESKYRQCRGLVEMLKRLDEESVYKPIDTEDAVRLHNRTGEKSEKRTRDSHCR
jgi:predicted NUDIX family phosphoesterase